MLLGSKTSGLTYVNVAGPCIVGYPRSSPSIGIPKDLFGTVRINVAQLLLSQSDFMHKEHWTNVILGAFNP